jgi:hypothetical protein
MILSNFLDFWQNFCIFLFIPNFGYLLCARDIVDQMDDFNGLDCVEIQRLLIVHASVAPGTSESATVGPLKAYAIEIGREKELVFEEPKNWPL